MTYLSINESQVEWNAWVSWFGSSSCFLIGQVVLIELTWHWKLPENIPKNEEFWSCPGPDIHTFFLAFNGLGCLYWDVLVWNGRSGMSNGFVLVFVLDGIGVWEMGIGVLFSLFMKCSVS